MCERNKDESFKAYKVRRASNNEWSKRVETLGTFIWRPAAQGTYIKRRHGNIGILTK